MPIFFVYRKGIDLVPLGGGEADYTVTIHNATYIPRVGEYISLIGDEAGRRSVFCVLYVIAQAVRLSKEGEYKEEAPVVQAEFVRHPYQSNAHARSIEMYASRGKLIHDYPESGY